MFFALSSLLAGTIPLDSAQCDVLLCTHPDGKPEDRCGQCNTLEFSKQLLKQTHTEHLGIAHHCIPRLIWIVIVSLVFISKNPRVVNILLRVSQDRSCSCLTSFLWPVRYAVLAFRLLCLGYERLSKVLFAPPVSHAHCGWIVRSARVWIMR